MPGREWHVDFSSGNYLNVTEDEYDQMFDARRLEGKGAEASLFPASGITARTLIRERSAGSRARSKRVSIQLFRDHAAFDANDDSFSPPVPMNSLSRTSTAGAPRVGPQNRQSYAKVRRRVVLCFDPQRTCQRWPNAPSLLRSIFCSVFGPASITPQPLLSMVVWATPATIGVVVALRSRAWPGPLDGPWFLLAVVALGAG